MVNHMGFPQTVSLSMEGKTPGLCLEMRQGKTLDVKKITMKPLQSVMLYLK